MLSLSIAKKLDRSYMETAPGNNVKILKTWYFAKIKILKTWFFVD